VAAFVVVLPSVALAVGASPAAATVCQFTLFHSIEGPYAIVEGPDGALWFTNSVTNDIGRVNTTGMVTLYRHPGIAGPEGIATCFRVGLGGIEPPTSALSELFCRTAPNSTERKWLVKRGRDRCRTALNGPERGIDAGWRLPVSNRRRSRRAGGRESLAMRCWQFARAPALQLARSERCADQGSSQVLNERTSQNYLLRVGLTVACGALEGDPSPTGTPGGLVAPTTNCARAGLDYATHLIAPMLQSSPPTSPSRLWLRGIPRPIQQALG
jgi:hypothetical protein